MGDGAAWGWGRGGGVVEKGLRGGGGGGQTRGVVRGGPVAWRGGGFVEEVPRG